MSYSNYDLNSKVNYLNSVITSTIPVINSKISSLQVPPTPNELVVVDTITVADVLYPAQNNTTTITPTQITITDTGGVNISALADDRMYVQNSSSVAEITPTTLTMTDALTNNFSSLGYDGFIINDVTTNATNTIDKNSITMTAQPGGLNQLIISNDPLVSEPFIQLDNSLGVSNKLDYDRWTGNINSVNTTANLVHYLGFFDSIGTGYGKPQKNALLTCNPALSIISATTFSGNATSSSTATGVNLTSDNTLGTYFLPFSKTSTATGNSLFIDNTTTPLTYVPSTSTLNATNFSGLASSASNLVITSDNTNGSYYIPFSKVSAGTNPLYVDDVTSPLTYNPSTGLMSALYFLGDDILPTTQNTATFAGTTLSFSGASSGTAVSFRNASVVITGGSNTLSALTITNTLVNGTYKIGILNNGSGNFTINTTLGANIKTVFSGGFNISNGRYGWLTIDVVIINAVTTYVVNAFQLTN